MAQFNHIQTLQVGKYLCIRHWQRVKLLHGSWLILSRGNILFWNTSGNSYSSNLTIEFLALFFPFSLIQCARLAFFLLLVTTKRLLGATNLILVSTNILNLS